MSNNLSNAVVINGDNYEIEIYLLRDPGGKGGSIIPISFTNVRYLEITNDLANLGYYGKIAFTNFDDILEQLGVLKASKKIPLMYFRLKSLSFSGNTTYDDIYFTAALTQGQDVKEDEIQGISTYNFEELYVFKLKTTKLLRGDNISNNYNATSGEGTISEMLKILLRFNTLAIDPTTAAEVDGELIDPSISGEIIETGTPLEDKIHPNAIIDLKPITTLHDAIKQANVYLCYKPQNSKGDPLLTEFYDPGLIKLENDINNKPGNSKGARKFVMFPLLGTINKFFNILSTGNWTQQETDTTKKYFDKFLTEQFTLSQKSQSPTFSNNTLTKYELKRVDLSDVLGYKWTGVHVNQSTDSCSITTIIKYEKVRDAFERLCTSPFVSNLPVSNDSIAQYNRSGLPINTAVSYGTNSVLKSFIFDNVLATFRIGGQPYRKPNRFIAINTILKDGKLSPVNSKERTEIDGFWYVLSVNHVFIDGNYFNDFECVRIYELGGTVEQPEPSTAPPPSPTPTGNTNGPGETPLPAVAPDTIEEFTPPDVPQDVNLEFPLLPPKPVNDQLG